MFSTELNHKAQRYANIEETFVRDIFNDAVRISAIQMRLKDGSGILCSYYPKSCLNGLKMATKIWARKTSLWTDMWNLEFPNANKHYRTV